MKIVPTEAKGRKQELARPLKVLVPLINQDIRDGDEAGLPYYIAAGEKLIEAKKGGEVKVGEWRAWAAEKFGRPYSTLQKWMQYAAKPKKITHDFSGNPRPMRHVLEPKRIRRDKAKNEIWEEVKKANPERMEKILREEKESNAEKAKIEATRKKLGRDLALKLIKIGYNALAMELHPDKKGNNGSHEVMSLLNDVASYLRGWANEYQG